LSIDERYSSVTNGERIVRKTRDLVLVAIAAGSLSCASPDVPPRFQLTVIGIQVENSERTLQFYEDKLGIHIFQRRQGGAMVSPGWTLPVVEQGRGLTVEVFETTAAAPANRSFGTNQSVRPSVQVRALKQAVDAIRERGAPVTEDVQPGGIGERAVVRTPEGIEWTIAYAEGKPAGESLADPHFGWLGIKAADLEAQVRFYSEMFGMQPEYHGTTRILGQGAGLPFLVFYPGGSRRSPDPPPTLENSPVWLAFQTPDINTAFAWAKSRGATVTREITLIPQIGLQYFVVEDPDGNPVQVFESAAPEWLRRIAYRYFFPLFWELTD
jgi:predicted enzyme related to lactoylglutathione lyase